MTERIVLTKFFRINDKATISRPSIAAVGLFLLLAALTLLIFRNSSIISILIAWPLEYILACVLFSQPVRISLGIIMYFSRYRTALALRSSREARWLKANQYIFKKNGVDIFRGVDPDAPKKKRKKNTLNKVQKITKEINVNY